MALRLLIGNRRYSSWSLRSWLVCKLSGLAFETELIPLDGPDFVAARADGRLPSGRVPVLWDGDAAVWETPAIIAWLAERAGAERLWPADRAAHAFALSIATEMHGGFGPLREACPMDLKRPRDPLTLSGDALTDLRRIDTIWTQARHRFGADGNYLVGAFGAADAMYAPVAHRVHAYALPVSAESARYVDAVLAHSWLREWVDAIGDEPEIHPERLTPTGPWRAPDPDTLHHRL